MAAAGVLCPSILAHLREFHRATQDESRPLFARLTALGRLNRVRWLEIRAPVRGPNAIIHHLKGGKRPLSDLDRFKQYYYLAAQLLDVSTKDELAELARLLALHIAHHRTRYGEIPVEALFSRMGERALSDEHCRLLAEAMETLVGYLGNLPAVREQSGH